MSVRYIWLLRSLEQRIRDGHTGRVQYTVDFQEGGIRSVRADELKRVATHPEPSLSVGGKER